MEDGYVWCLQEWESTDFANIALASIQSLWRLSDGPVPGLKWPLTLWFVQLLAYLHLELAADGHSTHTGGTC